MRAETHLRRAETKQRHRADEMVHLIRDRDAGDFARHQVMLNQPAGKCDDAFEELAIGDGCVVADDSLRLGPAESMLSERGVGRYARREFSSSHTVPLAICRRLRCDG
jgi:hypothetical protein